MPVYTVHAPIANNAGIAATDRFAFVRDGFHVWAALATVVWLAWHRLWLALIGWIIAVAAIESECGALGAGRMAIFLANVLIALLMGFEAASLRRWTLSRRNWRQLDIVVADDEESAERAFFSIAGPPSSARSATISWRSIAARRRRPGIFRASRFQSRRRCRQTTSSDCFRNRERRGERCHHRLRFRQSALRRESVRARQPRHGNAGKDRGDPRSRDRVSRRSHCTARRRRLRRLQTRPRRACTA